MKERDSFSNIILFIYEVTQESFLPEIWQGTNKIFFIIFFIFLHTRFLASTNSQKDALSGSPALRAFSSHSCPLARLSSRHFISSIPGAEGDINLISSALFVIIYSFC